MKADNSETTTYHSESEEMQQLSLTITRLSVQLKEFSKGLESITENFKELDRKLSDTIAKAAEDRTRLEVTISKLDALADSTTKFEETKAVCNKRFLAIETDYVHKDTVHELEQKYDAELKELTEKYEKRIQQYEQKHMELSNKVSSIGAKLSTAAGIAAFLISLIAIGIHFI